MTTSLTSLGKLYVVILVGGICFILVSIVIGRWFYISERKNERQADMIVATSSLAGCFPNMDFGEMINREGKQGASDEEKIMTINRVLQPIVDNAAGGYRNVKLGFYSLESSSIVAFGPDFSPGLLGPVKISDNNLFPSRGAFLSGEIEHSVLWDGQPALVSCAPIVHQEKLIGYAFASVSMADVFHMAMVRNAYSLFVALLFLTLIIGLVHRGFQKIKNDLQLFAGSMTRGDFEIRAEILPELLPVLELIKNQSMNMARLDRLNIIGQLAASIGHEIRNPLTVVRGYLQFLGDKSEMRSFQGEFSLMIAELDRANSIITEYLSLAKHKAPTLEVANLNEVIMEINPLLQADALESNCQIELSLEPIHPVALDVKEVRQLILNLVRNAFQAMPSGGKMTIHTYNNDDQVVMAIKDEGQGISSLIIDKLGTPFLSTKENGTGLGLAICYQIADRHNARIKVESHTGIGTIFSVIFQQAK